MYNYVHNLCLFMLPIELQMKKIDQMNKPDSMCNIFTSTLRLLLLVKYTDKNNSLDLLHFFRVNGCKQFTWAEFN